MPYASNSDLPSYVKKLPDNKQSQWRSVFNSCMSDGGEEAKCFRMANGVVKKEVNDFAYEGEVASDEELAEKSYGDALGADEAPVVLIDAAKLARADMDASSFAYIDSDGGRHLPIHDRAHVRNALARFNQTKFESASAKRTARRKIMAAAKKFGIDVTEKDAIGTLTALLGVSQDPIIYKGGVDLSVAADDAFYVVKQADGKLRWFGRYSNAWLDRDGEILTEEAHKDYQKWAYDNGTLPELWLWHVPGSRIGEADWLDFTNGFAVASGLVDNGKESVIEALKSQDLGMSHGFLALQQGKWVRRYRSYELSVLPRERAAVETSGFNVLDATKGAEVMAFSVERRKWLVEALGEEAVNGLEKSTDAMATQLKELGVEYKESEAQAAKTDETATQTEGFKTLATQVAELTTTVGKLVGVVGGITKEVEAVKTAQTKTDDEKVEDAFLAKVAKAFGQNGGVVRPTESTKNVEGASTPTEEAKQIDFFSQMIGEQLGTLQKAASQSSVGTSAVGSVTVNDGVQEVRD